MSWLARSIANSLKLDDDDPQPNTNPTATTAGADPSSPHKAKLPDAQSDSPTSPSNQSPRGVKEDLTELKKTLTRQLWGVASFLAPPPDPSPPPSGMSEDRNPSSPPQSDRPPPARDSADQEASDDDEALIAGIRSDFAEIGGKFKTGISKLSQNKTVWEFTKIASNFLQLGSESEFIDADLVGNAVGVTEEVLAFARNIAMHPETWLDFPLPDDNDDSDDFDLSDAQQEHALAIERLAPRLGALRIELCPGYMSEGSFWKIYFVLLHPRLSKEDAALLSTPQIAAARAMLMQELQSRNKAKLELDTSASGTSVTEVTVSSCEEHLSVPSSTDSKSVQVQPSPAGPTNATGSTVVETDKHPVQSNEIKIIDKSVVDEGPPKQTKYEHSHSGSSPRAFDDKYEDEADDWLKEETSEISEVKGTTVPIDNDEDVSFSDLEEDDDDAPASYKKVAYGSDSSAKDSRDWVRLGGSSDDSGKESKDTENSGKAVVRDIEIKESSDWLDVDDDVDEV
ncbi:uncharacterized protein LOC116208128 [Punica granatum]|uniref:BSD domain-containing protein n=2 Tax=Punica granatum TaxID=22663 RepID=A0A218XA22_PUNGR|nr:uncharacterized protein LOC116208128 [Punica granatum]OWM82085.1 hypothetical protein CDL15_Pgr001659 [Punica granatum]PKI44857.1 hypothetical protein CRG98_034805 [Punica granatum]